MDIDAIQFVHSTTLPELLLELALTPLVSTYQAGKLIAARSTGSRISTLLRTFDQVMGLAVDVTRITVATRSQIWFLRNAPDIAPQLDAPSLHDACYVPRSCHVTGDIRVHEIGWAGDELWLVNTRFSCLCTLHADYSFVPRWRPPFVSAFAAEDRCHLNGLCISDGQPKYVTALGETDTPDGWRKNKAHGGILIDVDSGETIARDLSMPHSPRLHNGRLWLLDSGTGRLVTVDESTGGTETVAQFPGYTRGLAFHDRYAFVGLSKIRETSTFGGLPIAEHPGDLKCGIWIIDIDSGQTVAMLEFQSGIEEIFDVQLLPDIRYPAIIGFERETIDGIYIVPPEFLPA